MAGAISSVSARRDHGRGARKKYNTYNRAGWTGFDWTKSHGHSVASQRSLASFSAFGVFSFFGTMVSRRKGVLSSSNTNRWMRQRSSRSATVSCFLTADSCYQGRGCRVREGVMEFVQIIGTNHRKRQMEGCEQMYIRTWGEGEG